MSTEQAAALTGAQQSFMLQERARRVFPAGITRATVDRDPALYYIERGAGAHLVDVDGNRFLDLNNNFTTLIHGHAFPPVVEAVTRVLSDGTCFSNPTRHEIHLAELLCARIPAVERIRFVNTGTEAVMFAIKAARAFTERPAIAKIEGAYHGAYDWAEVGQAGTPATWGTPADPVTLPHYRGQPRSVCEDVVLLRFNDAEGARRRIAANAERLACVLIDPVPSRAGLIAPDPAFLAAVVETARANGILVIVDEVLNFRQGFQGVAARFGIEADLLALGKIIGGGFPIGAIGGSAKVMQVFEEPHLLAQGGTFSANPVSMVAGLAAMQAMTEPEFDRLERLGRRLRSGLEQAIAARSAPLSVSGSASLFRIHPKRERPTDYRSGHASPEERARMRDLHHHFKTEGILLPMGAAACLSTPMQEAEIAQILDVFERFLDRTEMTR